MSRKRAWVRRIVRRRPEACATGVSAEWAQFRSPREKQLSHTGHRVHRAVAPTLPAWCGLRRDHPADVELARLSGLRPRGPAMALLDAKAADLRAATV